MASRHEKPANCPRGAAFDDFPVLLKKALEHPAPPYDTNRFELRPLVLNLFNLLGLGLAVRACTLLVSIDKRLGPGLRRDARRGALLNPRRG